MMRETMCDTCMAPGNCCKRMFLSGSIGIRPERPFELTAGRIQEPMSFDRAEHMALKAGLWMMRPSHQDELGHWHWLCTQLQPDGRCGIYENRPPLCRHYRPGHDAMCVHYWEQDPAVDPLTEVEQVENPT